MDSRNPIIDMIDAEMRRAERATDGLTDIIVGAITRQSRVERTLDRELEKCVRVCLDIAKRKSQEAFRKGNRTDAQFFGSLATVMRSVEDELEKWKEGR